MQLNIGRELTALQQMTVKQLRQKYAEVFGEETNAYNKPWLIKRIAWRLQALAEGDLTERARRRAAELADDAQLRLVPPRVRPISTEPTYTTTASVQFRVDDRLPPPGTVITRCYKGEVLHVTVLPQGFEYKGEVYNSLSAVAKAITGSHYNGYLFFRLGGKGGDK